MDTVDLVEDIRDFHVKFGLDYNGLPRHLPEELLDFRIKFLEEELVEYKLASADLSTELGLPSPNMRVVAELLESQLDALIDLVYVALGTAHLAGFDFTEGWRRVHAANMAKVRATDPSQSKRGSSLDVVKPKGWQPPDHGDLVRNHAHYQPNLFSGK